MSTIKSKKQLAKTGQVDLNRVLTRLSRWALFESFMIFYHGLVLMDELLGNLECDRITFLKDVAISWMISCVIQKMND